MNLFFSDLKNKILIYESSLGILLLILGFVIEILLALIWPVGWVHGVALQATGIAIIIDAIIYPNEKPSPILIGSVVIMYGLILA
jgi:hypothetical protein